MVSINDIYFKIDSSIVPQGFWEANTEAKKKLIDNELKKYIIDKIQELRGTTGIISEADKEYNVAELLEILAGLIPKEQHFDTLRHFTHYILQVAGTLQNWAISWWKEDEESIQYPFVEFDENNFWQDLKTHKDTDYVKTFNFVYDIFNNAFMIKTFPKKLEKALLDDEG